MKKVIIALVFILSTCFLNSQTLTKLDQEFFSFLKEFKETIRSNNKEKLATLINFPIYTFNCENIIFKNKFQFMNNKPEDDFLISESDNDLMKFLQKRLKYFDKANSIGEKLFEQNENSVSSINIDKLKIDEDFLQNTCLSEINNSFYYIISVHYEIESDGEYFESSEIFEFFKLGKQYKLVSYWGAG